MWKLAFFRRWTHKSSVYTPNNTQLYRTWTNIHIKQFPFMHAFDLFIYIFYVHVWCGMLLLLFCSLDCTIYIITAWMHSRPNQLIRERAMKSSRSLIICLVLRVVPLIACVLAIDPMEWTYIKRANSELCGVNFYDFSDAFNCINSLHSLNICIINFLFNYLYEKNTSKCIWMCVWGWTLSLVSSFWRN